MSGSPALVCVAERFRPLTRPSGDLSPRGEVMANSAVGVHAPTQVQSKGLDGWLEHVVDRGHSG
jgi:hypothetical protein